MYRNLHDYLSNAARLGGRLLPISSILLVIFLMATRATGAPEAADGGLPAWQEPRPVKNLVVDSNDSTIGLPVALGEQLFFLASDQGVLGNIQELWRTDGTSNGTVRLEAYEDWYFDSPVALNDKLIFLADDSEQTTRFWISDGTPNNARPMLDFAENDPFSSVNNITSSGNYIFFTAYDDTNRTQLWRTDGTSGGTIRLTGKDMNLDASPPDNLINVDGTLYFSWSNYDPAEFKTYTYLGQSDGTSEGTTLVGSLEHGSGDYLPTDFTSANGMLFFFIETTLWQSDGTEAGTGPMYSWPSSSIISASAAGDSNLYIIVQAHSGSNPYSHELWQISGTPAKLSKVSELEEYYDFLVTVGNRAFFVAFDSFHGYELWTSDGTNAGTKLVKDLKPGSEGSDIGPLLAVGERIYFTAFDINDSSTYSLWRSDGTAAGTLQVPLAPDKDGHSYPEPIADLNGRLFFTAADLHHGQEPWITNDAGTSATFLKDINNIDNGSSLPRTFNFTNDTLFFIAGGDVGGGLWRSDGTEAGTFLLFADQFDQQEVRQSRDEFGIVGNTLFFLADNFVTGSLELWRSDGSAAGTSLVNGVSAHVRVEATELTDVGGWLYFTLFNGRNRKDLWRSDGTPDGTHYVATPNIDPEGSSEIRSITAVGAKAFFSATDGISGPELWQSDGTTVGTYLVRDINPGAGVGSNPTELTAFNGRIYFFADDGVHGVELWSSDGTAEGTGLVKDIKPGAESSMPEELTFFNGALYFVADDGAHGRELWRSDGTSAGTTIVKDIVAEGGSAPMELTPGQDWLYFVAFDDEAGYQPWKSNGTAAGSQRIAILEYNEFAWPRNLTAVGNTLFFTTVLQTVEYFYQSDGTAAGTVSHGEAFPNHGMYEHNNLTPTPGRLFYSATSLIYGNEPFVQTVSLTQHTPAELYLTEGGQAGSFPLALAFRPAAAVTIKFTSEDPAVKMTPSSVTITPQDWNKTVTIHVHVIDERAEQTTRQVVLTQMFESADASIDGAVLTMPVHIGWQALYAPVTMR